MECCSVGKDDEKHRKFVQNLAPEERLLILLRDELYGGRWDYLRQDLEDRKAGRPYVFKLASRIEDDLRRIERLEAYEKKYGINLADYMSKESER